MEKQKISVIVVLVFILSTSMLYYTLLYKGDKESITPASIKTDEEIYVASRGIFPVARELYVGIKKVGEISPSQSIRSVIANELGIDHEDILSVLFPAPVQTRLIVSGDEKTKTTLLESEPIIYTKEKEHAQIYEGKNVVYSQKEDLSEFMVNRGFSMPEEEQALENELEQGFILPLKAADLSSTFGPRWGSFHQGIDLARKPGGEILAAKGGKVIQSGYEGEYGYCIVIDHEDGFQTLYAHGSELLVREGETVQQGQLIMYSGDTGNVTGPHLHFEIHKDDQPVDPLEYVRYDG